MEKLKHTMDSEAKKQLEEIAQVSQDQRILQQEELADIAEEDKRIGQSIRSTF